MVNEIFAMRSVRNTPLTGVQRSYQPYRYAPVRVDSLEYKKVDNGVSVDVPIAARCRIDAKQRVCMWSRSHPLYSWTRSADTERTSQRRSKK